MCTFSIDIGPVRSHQDDLKSKVGCTSNLRLRARLLSSTVSIIADSRKLQRPLWLEMWLGNVAPQPAACATGARTRRDD